MQWNDNLMSRRVVLSLWRFTRYARCHMRPCRSRWFLMLKWYFLYWICISRGLNYVFNDKIQNSSQNWGFCGEGGWKMSKIFGFQKMRITRWDLSLSFSKGYIRYSNFSSSFRICSKKLEKPLFKHKKWPFLDHFWLLSAFQRSARLSTAKISPFYLFAVRSIPIPNF